MVDYVCGKAVCTITTLTCISAYISNWYLFLIVINKELQLIRSITLILKPCKRSDSFLYTSSYCTKRSGDSDYLLMHWLLVLSEPVGHPVGRPGWDGDSSGIPWNSRIHLPTLYEGGMVGFLWLFFWLPVYWLNDDRVGETKTLTTVWGVGMQRNFTSQVTWLIIQLLYCLTSSCNFDYDTVHCVGLIFCQFSVCVNINMWRSQIIINYLSVRFLGVFLCLFWFFLK